MSALHWVPAWSDVPFALGYTKDPPIKTACGRKAGREVAPGYGPRCATSDRDFSCSPEGRCKRCWKAWRAL